MLIKPTISYLNEIYFDFGAVKLLAGILAKYAVSRPLIITDKGLIRLGIIEKLSIGEKSALYDGVETNPTEIMVLEALQLYRAHNCDGIVAAGGGSSIDLAKCVALLVHHPQPLQQYAIHEGGSTKITSAMPPLIALPTTSGSGSEVGRAALITLEGAGKLGFLSNHLLPVAAVCDPGLTTSLPPALTASTGMDAISHCVETFCSPRYNPVADSIALDGLQRGFTNITRATFHGAEQGPRSEMMMSSLQGGLAFQKGLGAVHSLSHPLGALTEKGLHHGTLNAIFLPFVLRFNYDHCKEKMQAIAKRLNIQHASELPESFTHLNHILKLPATLRELGLTKLELEPLAEKALRDHCTPTNPRPMEMKDLHELYIAAW